MLKVTELLTGAAEIQTQGWLPAGQDQLVIQQSCKQQLKPFKGIVCFSYVDMTFPDEEGCHWWDPRSHLYPRTISQVGYLECSLELM